MANLVKLSSHSTDHKRCRLVQIVHHFYRSFMAVPVEEAIAALSTFSLEVIIMNYLRNNRSFSV